jgi:hypothetical protein
MYVSFNAALVVTKDSLILCVIKMYNKRTYPTKSSYGGYYGEIGVPSLGLKNMWNCHHHTNLMKRKLSSTILIWTSTGAR